MKTSQRGIDLIKEFEGFSAVPYLCPAKILTWGYGHACLRDPHGNPLEEIPKEISKEKAEEILRADVEIAEEAVNKYVTPHYLNQNIFDALVSFTFNIGYSNFKNSTLLKFINQGKIAEAASQFERWVYAKGKELPGLVKRRKKEKELFLAPVDA